MAQEEQARQEYITVHVPSRFEYIRPIQAFVGQLAQQINFSQPRIHDIELVIDEICGNAIEHGSETPAAGIDLIITWTSSELEILVRDRGKKGREDWLSTDRLVEVSRQRAPGRPRGHGLYIAEELSNDCEIRANAIGGTDVRATFFVSNEVAE